MNEEEQKLECLRMAIQSNESQGVRDGKPEKSDVELAKEYYEFVSGSKSV